jgi:protein phosphatase
VRNHNEDSLLVAPPLYVIADGMGGHAAGEVASELAVRALEDAHITGANPELLREAVVAANDAVVRGAREGLGRAGMGTTLTAAVIEGDQLLIAQVGDSRAYLLQDGQLRQVTRDHSLVEELISAGQINRSEARTHPNRSVITRALGSDSNVLPDLYEMRLRTNDRLLLCSDGLNTMLDTNTLQRLLVDNPDPQQAADALVEAANSAGGHDNITVIVVAVDEVNPRAVLRQKRRFVWGIVMFLLVFCLLTGAAMGGVYAYARNAAFLIDEGGYVTLYRGIPGDVLGIGLRWHVETTSIPTSALNPAAAEGLRQGITMESMDAATERIRQYEKQYAGQGTKQSAGQDAGPSTEQGTEQSAGPNAEQGTEQSAEQHAEQSAEGTAQ